MIRAVGSAPIDRLATDVDGRVTVTVDASGTRGRHRLSRGLRPGWQIGLLTAGVPIWWALGIMDLVLPVLAAPLAWQLRRRAVRVPPGFWLWMVFLVWVAASGAMLNYQVPDTIGSEGIGHYISFGVRLLQYLAVTVVLLYVGNATEKELPRARLIRWMAWLAVSTVALGVAAMLFPTFEFETLMTRLLPDALAAGGDTARLAQVQDIIGDPEPRPAAPFAYTNAWGNALSLCLIWAVMAWGVLGSLGKRVLLVCLLLIAAVPIVHSLNRAVWMGLMLALVYVVARLAMRGRLLVGFVSLLVASVAAVAFVVSPLSTLVSERLENPHSNDIRAALADASWDAAEASPIIGAGSTRLTVGSETSIAIGASPDCPKCGNRVIGSTGQFWLLLIAQGFVGAALYLGFLLRIAWFGRHDNSPLGIAATLVLLLQVFYAFFYSALTVPLTIAMISAGLLWRNDRLRRESLAERTPATVRTSRDADREVVQS
ncbi:O-antigen ligase family protein [Solicola gregarius]|uniref:O-antigen ligase family protein n=1 Tax=Solicola gregarius TaxID=2908642 RepID=A0AA46TJP5_9ACTN|nr:O-antigen ligase family protein [Solicola gregarius]UYM06556.1 O-antigen ligase family protein [Solicola gregarius]